MFVISTRNFPPEVGGMQNLMGGLAKALVNHGPVKVFADKSENFESFDKYFKAKIERFGGIKLLRKYRKANRVGEFIKNNKNVRSIFFDHWKSVEKINYHTIKNFPSFCLIHSKEINHSVGSTLNKRVLVSIEKVKFVIANSKYTKNLAISIGIPETKIHIIHPGCDEPIEIDKNFQLRANNIYQNSFPRLLTVARLDKRKNHQSILMCVRNLKEKFPKIKYVSIGDGEEKKLYLSFTDASSGDGGQMGPHHGYIFIGKASGQIDKISVHELLHGLGFAMPCSKGQQRGAHLGSGILGPDLQKKLGKAIYNHGDPTCPDLKDSVYLTPTSDNPFDPLPIACALSQKVRGYPPGNFEIPARYTHKKLLKGRKNEWCTFGVYPNAKLEWFKKWKE